MKRTFTTLSLAMLLLAQLALAQGAATPPAFEKADLQPSAPGTREGGGFLPEGRIECQGTSLLKLIAMAYGVTTDLVQGGPDWLASLRFDISAKAPSRLASPAALREMLQALLADRFALAVHDDQRDMPVYILSVGSNGPKLQPAVNPKAPDCPSVDGEPGVNHRACRAFSMSDLAIMLPQVARNYVDRQVVDTTGLPGSYDFQLDWTGKAAYLDATAVGRPAVSLFDAIEKLGLKLEPGTRPTHVIVIDRVNQAPKQIAPAVPTEFEVAEVRPSKPPARQKTLRALPSGQLEMMGYTLRELIATAFNVSNDRIKGGPKWFDTDRFDVIAKSPEVMSPHALSVMLKTLIVQRFKLQTHTESEPVSVFALQLAKAGLKLQESDGTARSECKLTLAQAGRAYVCRNTTMAQFTERLPDVAQAYLVHPLVDSTGLTAAYDFTLTWTPKNRLPAIARQPSDGALQASTPDGDLTLFEAIDKQLGLKIEEQKQPMPVIVIDRVERTPKDNL